MGKHLKDESYIKKEKSKLKIIIPICITIIAIIIVVIYFRQQKYNEEKQLQETINQAFTALKEGKKEEASQFLDYEKLITSLDEMILEADEASNIEKELFKDMVWSIESIKTDKEKTMAIVEVTNKDFKEVITNWLKEVIKEKSAGQQISNKLALEKLQEILQKDNQETKTVIKKITLKQKDKKNWEIEVNEELRDLIFPEIDSVATVLNSNN